MCVILNTSRLLVVLMDRFYHFLHYLARVKSHRRLMVSLIT